MNDDDLINRLAALEREPRSTRWSEQSAARLCSLYEAATPFQRQFMREAVQLSRWRSPEHRTLAGGPTGSLATEERIRVALLMQSIEDGRHDLRDNLISLRLIYHSAAAVGMDVERLFEGVAAISSERMGGSSGTSWRCLRPPDPWATTRCPRPAEASAGRCERSGGHSRLAETHRRGGIQSLGPPLTAMAAPVRYAPRSEHKNAMTLPMSSGRHRRPKGAYS